MSETDMSMQVVGRVIRMQAVRTESVDLTGHCTAAFLEPSVWVVSKVHPCAPHDADLSPDCVLDVIDQDGARDQIILCWHDLKTLVKRGNLVSEVCVDDVFIRQDWVLL